MLKKKVTTQNVPNDFQIFQWEGFEGAYICTDETKTLRKDPENLLMCSLGDGWAYIICVYAFHLFMTLFITEKYI